MTEAARNMAIAEPLRVAVEAADPHRRAQLRAAVAAAGHRLVETAADADVVLALDATASEGRPVVTLGGADTDQAGLLPREAIDAQIDAALRAAAAGLIVRSPRDGGFAALAETNLAALLTPREIEVLSAIGEGLGNKAIARKLDISLHTVKFHIESIFRKLAVRSRAEAVAKGLERVTL
jgi:DNA-binding CsgD family transcriptional regulator